MSGLARNLQAGGDWLNRRRDLIAGLQIAMLALYLLLLLGPLLLPLHPDWRTAAARLARAEEAIFWGLWWPGVILSMLLVGQFWCGLLCPDGAASEWISRVGRHRKPAAWLRGSFWSLGGFAGLTLFSDLFDAHRSPQGTLIAVGGASALALLCGYVFGRGKRIWCRYLCPLAGLFSLLARSAVLHFRVERAVWDAAPRPVPKPVECPLLLDVRRLTGNEKCNMCARCSGHRGAVALAFRPPGAEIIALRDDELRRLEAGAICFVLIGLTFAGLHGRDLAPAASLPVLAGLVLGLALLLGGAVAGGLLLAGRGQRRLALRLAYALIPLAGLGLLAGSLPHALTALAHSFLDVTPALAPLRTGAVLIGAGWSWLTGRAILAAAAQRWLALAGWSALLAGLAALYLATPLPRLLG